jgi:hypothetical protein
MKKFNLLNSNTRALIKRVTLLPNVSEFYTFKYSVDEYSLIYGIEKVLRKIEVKAHKNGKSNKYLLKQFNRLSRMAIEGKEAEYAYLSDKITKKSITFRIVAMNRKYKDWWLVNSKRRLTTVWKRLGALVKYDSSDINFKRVWIDKKPKDYARPLGVPTMEWRIFSWMKMEIIERYLKGRGKLAPWQHGGRSGVGVLSCWKALIPKILEAKYVYEFDIKGFFDNISHKSIIREFEFEMKFMSEWIKGILKSKVKGYVLPPRKEDPGLLEIDRKDAFEQYLEDSIMNNPVWNDTDFYDVTADLYEPRFDHIGFLMEGLPATKRKPVRNTWSYYDLDPYTEDDINRDNAASRPSPNRAFDWQYELPEKLDEKRAYEKGLRKEVLEREVQDLLEESGDSLGIGLFGLTKYSGFLQRNVMTDDERAKAREAWKKLAQAGKGVPQGLGTSPLISTFMTDMRFTELRNNIIMYMDDGLLFARTEQEMKKVIKDLKTSLRMMGLSIAKAKSGWVKKAGDWIQPEPKFLGMRFLPEKISMLEIGRNQCRSNVNVFTGFKTDEWTERGFVMYESVKGTIKSETRSGTSVEFPMRDSWENIATAAKMNNLSLPYMRKLYDKLLQTSAYEAGIKYGFLGCLIAEATYKDAPPMWVRKIDIQKGQDRRKEQASASKGFIWRSGELEHWTGSIHNITSIACGAMLSRRTRTKVLKYGAGGRGRKPLARGKK